MTQLTFLATRAQSKKFRVNAGYLFYETSEAFHFRSLDSMMGLDGQLSEVPPNGNICQ